MRGIGLALCLAVLAAVVFPGLAYAADPMPSPTLNVSYWGFDEGDGGLAHDSLNGNHGTIHGATWTAGIVGNALSFDGVDDYVSVPDSDSLTLNGEATVELWVKHDADNGGTLLWKRIYAGSNGWTLHFGFPNTVIGLVNDDAASVEATVPAAGWQHVALVYQQGMMKLYVDGALQNTRANPSGFQDTNADLYIGTDENANYFKGLIDEVTVCGVALTQEEIQQHYLHPEQAKQSCLQAIASQVSTRVEQLRELDFPQEVPVQSISREQHIQDMQQELDSRPESYWEFADQRFNALHLLPQGTSARQIAETFYGAAVLAYYDATENGITYVEGRASPVNLPAIMAHELTHALTDQHFPETYQTDMLSTDGGSAVSALVEGDAIVVQAGYQYFYGSQSSLGLAVPSAALSAEIVPVNIPEAISLLLQFPYIEGINFIMNLGNQGGWATINQTYLNPPSSTEQVIHPGKYPNEVPVDVAVPPPGSQRWHMLDEDTLGELGIFAMFYNQGMATLAPIGNWWTYSSPLSAGWAGDKLVVYESTGEQFGYIWIAMMDTLQDSEEFEGGYLQVLDKLGAQPDGTLWRLGENDYISVQRDEEKVTIVRAPSPTGIAELSPNWTPWAYDANEDGAISRTEAVAALMDYFGLSLSRERVIQVLMLYFSG